MAAVESIGLVWSTIGLGDWSPDKKMLHIVSGFVRPILQLSLRMIGSGASNRRAAPTALPAESFGSYT